MLRGSQVKEIQELRRQGLSLRAISRVLGCSRHTVRKYLSSPTSVPQYGPRPKRPSKLDPFKAYIDTRLEAGVWNAQVLLRELRGRGYPGGYTILTDYLRPKRQSAAEVATRRFETPAGHQAQVDWGHLGSQTWEGGSRQPLWGFVLTLGHSRAQFVDVATDHRLATLLRLHEAAFHELGGVPKEILYDWMKTVVLERDGRGEVVWHPVFREFAAYWGFTPRLCQPYRAQTKGKVESGIKYLRGNFLCGRSADSLEDLRNQMRHWNWTVANRRVHGTTHRMVEEAWEEEKPLLQSLAGRQTFGHCHEEMRRVARDAYIHYRGNRYSVPWTTAGRRVAVRERDGLIEIRLEDVCLAVHPLSSGRHGIFTVPAHHLGIPMTSSRENGKNQIHLRVTPPQVEVRPLSFYDAIGLEDGG
ncbi:MAG: IS21 family transposase [Victivallales bacterium]|jgi:transposase|nr:IS21 family transposase [Victivallales bacterium]